MLALIAALHAQEAPPIVGGEETSEYPGVVYLQLGGYDGWPIGFCTGTVIADQWVLTAAHCLDDPYTLNVYAGPSLSAYEQVVEADAWFQNPDYESDPDLYDGYNDVGLVHLSSAFQGITPVPLSQQDVADADLGDVFRPVGYGLTSDSDDGNGGVKKYADIPLEFYNDSLFMLYDGEQAIASGDSGGPALRLFDNGSYAVAGVSDFTPIPPTGREGNASAFARVDYFLPWIDLYTTGYSLLGDAPPDDVARWAEDDRYEGFAGAQHGWDSIEPVEAPEDGLCSAAGPGSFGVLATVLGALAARRRQA